MYIHFLSYIFHSAKTLYTFDDFFVVLGCNSRVIPWGSLPVSLYIRVNLRVKTAGCILGDIGVVIASTADLTALFFFFVIGVKLCHQNLATHSFWNRWERGVACLSFDETILTLIEMYFRKLLCPFFWSAHHPYLSQILFLKLMWVHTSILCVWLWKKASCQAG